MKRMQTLWHVLQNTWVYVNGSWSVCVCWGGGGVRLFLFVRVSVERGYVNYGCMHALDGQIISQVSWMTFFSLRRYLLHRMFVLILGLRAWLSYDFDGLAQGRITLNFHGFWLACNWSEMQYIEYIYSILNIILCSIICILLMNYTYLYM